MMAVAAAQKNREMFAIKKSYSIEVSVWGKSIRKYLENIQKIFQNIKRFLSYSLLTFVLVYVTVQRFVAARL